MFLFGCECLLSQTTVIDSTFGLDGRFVTDLDIILSTAVQSDGKILSAGVKGIDGHSRSAIIRCNPDGTQDSTFGTNGMVVLSNSGFGACYKIVIDAHDKILMTGGSVPNFIVARLLPTGSMDLLFGTGGYASFQAWPTQSGNRYVENAVIQPDGKILLLGYQLNSNDFVVARLKANGGLDPLFGSGGVAVFDINPLDSDKPNGLTLLSNGKILVTSSYQFVEGHVTCLNADGTIDPTFGVNGVAVTPDIVGGVGVFESSNGTISVIGNYFSDQFIFLPGMTKLTSAGVVDSTFGTDGVVFINIPDISAPNDAVRQPDGKIIAAGWQNGYSGMIRFNTDGTLDETFGIDGFIWGYPAVITTFNCAALQPDGKIVVGTRFNDFKSVTIRYNSSASVGVRDVTTAIYGAHVYPNPVHGREMTVVYSLPGKASVKIELLDLLGRNYGVLLEGLRPAGECRETLALPETLAPGFYLLNICTERGNSVVKIWQE